MSQPQPKKLLHMMYDDDGRPYWHSQLSPEKDTDRSHAIVPPEHVVPVVFIPGIMGSNLKLKEPVEGVYSPDNIAWRPDHTTYTAWTFANLGPAERRRVLDPDNTEVDDRVAIPHSNFLFYKLIPANVLKNWKKEFTRRGWGSIFLASYHEILFHLEFNLNRIYNHEMLAEPQSTDYWKKNIFDVAATIGNAKYQNQWGEIKCEAGYDHALSMADLQKVGDTHMFPVHAAGYNWLRSNEDAGIDIGKRIRKIKEHYQNLGFDCEKVILVTHSMGGLAARAACHAEMGNIEDIVAGVVHGEQPALGAAAAYKRMRAGFAKFEIGWSPVTWLTARALGWSGKEVTAVLSNAPGGLELLPTKRYPAGWLKVPSENDTVKELPVSDPYEEIYAEKEKWWRLMNPEWIDPQVPAPSPKALDNTWEKYLRRLDVAKAFQDKLDGHKPGEYYYHPVTHAHYGADSDQETWGNFTWKKNKPVNSHSNMDDDSPVFYIPPGDDAQGSIRVESGGETSEFNITRPVDKGDGTVPEVSGEDSASKAKFSAKMTGYAHQDSYVHHPVMDVTTFSVARIAKDIK